MRREVRQPHRIIVGRMRPHTTPRCPPSPMTKNETQSAARSAACLPAGRSARLSAAPTCLPVRVRTQTGTEGRQAGRLQLADRGAMSFTRETDARRGHLDDNIPAPAQRHDRTLIGAREPALQSFGFAPHSLRSGTSQDTLWSSVRCEFDTGGAHRSIVWRPRSGRYVSPLGWAGSV